MSRFADPTATRQVDLGPCDCPGAPHARDEATIRAEASASDVRRFTDATSDDAASAAIADFIPAWNLLGPDGKPWPPSAESIAALKIPTLTTLSNAIGEVVRDSSTLPNASGGPSRGSPRGTASRPRTTSRTPTT